MTHPHSPWIDTPARIGLIILTALVVAGMCPLFFLVNQVIPPAVLRVAGAIALGLVAGFTSRLFLTGRSQLLRLLSAVVASACGLFLIHHLTSGFMGLALQPRWYGAPDWFALVQWLLCSASAWLVIQAKRTPKKLSQKPRPVSKQQSSEKRSKPAFHSSPARITAKAPLSIQHWLPIPLIRQSMQRWAQTSLKLVKKWHTSSLDVLKNFSRYTSHGVLRLKDIVPLGQNRPRKPIRLRKNKTGNKYSPITQTQVRLVGKQENRCPYCLELVEKNDPRGVKICPVCRTYHHADCWVVTGTCQVPHHHE